MPTLRALLDSPASGRGARLAARSPEGSRTSGPADADQGSGDDSGVSGPAADADEATTRSSPRSADLTRRPRRGRGLRTHPAGRSARDSASRHDQRPCVAAAEVPRRSADSSCGHRRRSRHRRHDHARRHGARRRTDLSHSVEAIGPDQTTPEVERRLADLGAGCSLRWSTTWRPTGPFRPQEHTLATHANKIEKHEGMIDWNLPAGRIHNLVRGLQPWPMVSTRPRRRAVPDSSDRADGSTGVRAGGTIVDGEKARPCRRGRRRRGPSDPDDSAGRPARDERAGVSGRPRDSSGSTIPACRRGLADK